ncbi:MAG: ABC transporter permease [Nostocoides sp.]
MSRPLSYAAEWSREVGRRRTTWILVVVLALPAIFVGAFALDTGSPGAATGSRFVDIATLGAANFTAFSLLVAAELLVFILAALLVGDPVPTEASWSSLRYLLTAPVGRARLLTSKLAVGLTHVLLVLIILPAWSFLIGSAAYGLAPLSIPGGGTLSNGDLLPRLVVAIGYLFVAVLPIAGLAFLIGVGSQTPLAAVGGALVVYIVSGILDTIDALGSWRNGLPGHYARAWLDLLQPTIDWTAMRHGLLWSLLWGLALFALGYWRFARRDVLS